MRSLILAATAAVLMTTTAHAEVKVTANISSWTAFTGKTGKNARVCGIGTFDATKSFMLKWLNTGENKIYIHAFKKGWKIPTGTDVSFEMKYDDDVMSTAAMLMARTI
jgi:hypothetical protein